MGRRLDGCNRTGRRHFSPSACARLAFGAPVACTASVRPARSNSHGKRCASSKSRGLPVPVPSEGTRTRGAAPGPFSGSGAAEPEVPLHLGQPTRPRRERNRFVEAAVILRIRKGLEPLRHAGGDVRSIQLPDFSAQPVRHSPGFQMQNLP